MRLMNPTASAFNIQRADQGYQLVAADLGGGTDLHRPALYRLVLKPF